MPTEPSFEDIFAVMAAASAGDAGARVPLPLQPNLEQPATRFAVALNVLLDDLAFRVAERERMEERLRQAQKMEAIGSLAGGVAHDFNNLLSVILGFVELVLDDLRPGEQWQSELTEVRRAGERARDLTRQLLAFSRKQVLKPVLLDLNVVLLEMEAMLRRLLGSCIELTVVTAVELGAIKADRGQLEQVIMNLVINARDAMQSTGGRLRIETSSVDLDASEAEKNPDLVPGSYVLLVVADNGAGMEPAVRARIFELFLPPKAGTRALVWDSPRSSASCARAAATSPLKASRVRERLSGSISGASRGPCWVLLLRTEVPHRCAAPRRCC